MALPDSNSATPSEPRHRVAIPAREQGYILIAVLFMTFMLLLTLSIAAPKVASDIERDREMELMHRGKQYQRAIQLYYRKFGAYPPNMDALVKTQEIRFLRKQYVDPATGKKEWHLIHFGEAKTPTLGFFGQPLAGTGGAGSSIMSGVGPSGGNANAGTPMGGAPGASGPGSSPGGFGSDSGGFSLGASPSSSPTGAAGATGASGAPTDPNASGGSNSLGSNTASSFGGSQQTFGGAGIIGVESNSPKETILEYKKKKHFNEWEFVYDPLSEQLTSNNGAAAGPSMGSAGNSATTFGGSSGSAFGGSSPQSGFGGSSGSAFGGSSPGGGFGGGSGGFGGSSSPAPAPSAPGQPQ